MWIVNPSIVDIIAHHREDGFVSAETKECCFISCYLSPNISWESFLTKLVLLEEFILQRGKQVILAGDFNAKSEEWGENRNDARGRELAEMAARLDLVVLSSGLATTFRRPGRRESILDVSFATPGIAKCIHNWKVVEEYNASDHMYIAFLIKRTPSSIPPHKRDAFIGWNSNKLDKEKFITVIKKGASALEDLVTDAPDRKTAEELAEKTTKLLVQACNKAMPRKYTTSRRMPMF